MVAMHTRRLSSPVVSLAAPLLWTLAALSGCEKKPDAAAGGASPEVAETYKTRCATCHGEDGKGSGPAGGALNPKPRDYTDQAWQGSVTDEQIKTVILKGGAAIGKSPLMPGAPDLEQKPEVLSGLVAKVRSFKK